MKNKGLKVFKGLDKDGHGAYYVIICIIETETDIFCESIALFLTTSRYIEITRIYEPHKKEYSEIKTTEKASTYTKEMGIEFLFQKFLRLNDFNKNYENNNNKEEEFLQSFKEYENVGALLEVVKDKQKEILDWLENETISESLKKCISKLA